MFLVNLDFDRKTNDLPKLRVNFKIKTNQTEKNQFNLQHFDLLQFWKIFFRLIAWHPSGKFDIVLENLVTKKILLWPEKNVTLFCYWFGKFSFFEKNLSKFLSKRWGMIQFLFHIGEVERDINDLKLKLSTKQVWEFIYFSILNCKLIANGAVPQTQHGFLWSKQKILGIHFS